MSTFKRIKTFLMRGNILDLATGVVIGTAFQKIILALIDKVFMLIMAVMIGGIDLKYRDTDGIIGKDWTRRSLAIYF
ncbi:MscL family protein [Emticicia sp. BO119]|uniref:MscL family protein n=1 Tax=Emticicia sp. BO119 TaxID=2757768 RepID=UPI0015EFEF5B|nr:MscL family protein [Emticicia sp. BO119]MBA4850423.1 MscL family protein [Emticicia sp. BO119]